MVYNIRKAEPDDLRQIVEYRITMFQTFIKDPCDWEAVKQFEVRYFHEKMRARQLWVMKYQLMIYGNLPEIM